jgi:CRP/FNR family transcriptional regulator, cyclic AMP receptor protein
MRTHESDPAPGRTANNDGLPAAGAGVGDALLPADGTTGWRRVEPLERTRDTTHPAPATLPATSFAARPGALPRLSDHAHCEALSALFRGSLCEQIANGPARRFAAGQYFYHMGGAATSVFLLRRGLAKVSVVSSRGQELTLRVYKSGEVFGELCLCTGERGEQAVALEESDAVEIPMEKFLARLREDPPSALDFAITTCERLAEAHERLRSLAVDPVLGRLVRTLLRLASEWGVQTPDGMRLAHHLRQDDLAQIVGARREVVSTLLNRLRERGLLHYTRRGVMHIDRERLQKLSDWLAADESGEDPILAT